MGDLLYLLSWLGRVRATLILEPSKGRWLIAAREPDSLHTIVAGGATNLRALRDLAQQIRQQEET